MSDSCLWTFVTLFFNLFKWKKKSVVLLDHFKCAYLLYSLIYDTTLAAIKKLFELFKVEVIQRMITRSAFENLYFTLPWWINKNAACSPRGMRRRASIALLTGLSLSCSFVSDNRDLSLYSHCIYSPPNIWTDCSFIISYKNQLCKNSVELRWLQWCDLSLRSYGT